MNNGFIHRMLLSSVEKEFVLQGWKCQREFRVNGKGWIDLLALKDSWKVAIEVELSPRRGCERL